MEDELGKRVVGQKKGRAGGVGRGPSQPGRGRRPQPPDRVVSCSSPDRCRQDRCWPRRWPTSCFDDERAMVRIDHSEYGESTRWLGSSGAPPVHRLTTRAFSSPRRCVAGRTRCAVRRGREGPPGRVRRAAAGPRRGPATDGQGRTVDFRNTILILTSNLVRAAARTGDGGGPVGLQAGVHQTASTMC